MLLAVMGLALTLLTLGLLAVGGYLLALRLLGAEARRDPLALAIAALLAATAEALAIGLALGICGALRIEAALAAYGLSTHDYYTTTLDRADKDVSMGGNTPGSARNAFGLRHAVSFLIETRGVGLDMQSFQRRVAKGRLHSAQARSAQ